MIPPPSHTVPLLYLPAEVERAAWLMVERLPDDATPLRGQTVEHVTLEVRRLARPGGMARTLTGETTVQLTGGVEVSARVPACAYDPVPGYLSGRMGPGWSRERLQRRIVYALQNALAYYQLRCRRDLMYSYMRSVQDRATEDLEMAMAEEEAVSGHNSVLREMTESDLSYWWHWIGMWAVFHTQS